MIVCSCANCGFRFQSAEKKKCPRCSSAETSEFVNDRQKTSSSGGQHFAAKSSFGAVKSGKEGWQEFHSTEMKACPDCGGVDFELNWKRKEKTCRKCGAVLPLPRRSA